MVNEKMNTNLCLFIGFEPQQHSNLDRSRVNDTSANKVVWVWVDACREKKLYNTLVFMVHLLVAGSHSQWVSFLLPPHFPSDTQPWRSFDSPEHNFVQSVSAWHDTVLMTGHVFIIFYFSAIFLTWEGMLRFFQREKNASPFISVGSMNLFTEIWKSVI